MIYASYLDITIFRQKNPGCLLILPSFSAFIRHVVTKAIHPKYNEHLPHALAQKISSKYDLWLLFRCYHFTSTEPRLPTDPAIIIGFH